MKGEAIYIMRVEEEGDKWSRVFDIIEKTEGVALQTAHGLIKCFSLPQCYLCKHKVSNCF